MKIVLSNAIDVISGGTPNTSKAEYWNGGIGWLSVADFNNGDKKVYKSEKTISELGLKNSSTNMLNTGDIIISARGTVGALAQLGSNMCFNQSCFGLRGKKNIIKNDYLYYALKNYIKNIQTKTQGSVFATINIDTFKLIEINIEDDLCKQQKIADVLSALDDKIELNNKINAELEATAKDLYNYWFVQFDFPDENGRPYKSSGGKMVYNPVLKREIPDGWRVVSLDSICDLYQPETISEKDCISNGKYCVYGSNNIIGKYDRKNHDDSEIIISCRGDCGNIIRTLPNVWITGNAMVVSPKETIVGKEFLYFMLKNAGLKRIVTGSVQGQITRKNLSPVKVLLPSKDILNLYNFIVKDNVELRIKNLLQKDHLVNLRDFLLPMLMNGQVSVE